MNWISYSGREMKRLSSVSDCHCLDDIATRKRPYMGTWEEMREHVQSVWTGALYHNTVGSGFWSRDEDTHIMVAECWPHRDLRGHWKWRIAKPESGGRRWA